MYARHAQLLQLQQQQQQWLASSAASVLPATQPARPLIGQSPGVVPQKPDGSPSGWVDGPNGGGQKGAFNRELRANVGNTPLTTRFNPPQAGRQGPHPPSSVGNPSSGLMQQQSQQQQQQPLQHGSQGQKHGIRSPTVQDGGGGRRSPSSSQGSKKTATKRTDSQALYVPKRRGPAGAGVAPAIQATGS